MKRHITAVGNTEISTRDRKVMRLIFLFTKVSILFIFFKYKCYPLQIVPLGSYTPMEKLFPVLVAALEVSNRHGLQHALYSQAEFVPPGQTVNQVFYKNIRERFRKRVIRVRPDIADKWMLHHENAPYHTPLSVTEVLTLKVISVVPTPLFT